jgi:hypothetical protein
MRFAIRLLNAEGTKLMKICKKMLAQHGTPRISKKQVYEWVHNFKNGLQMVANPPRPGQLSQIHTNMTTFER